MFDCSVLRSKAAPLVRANVGADHVWRVRRKRTALAADPFRAKPPKPKMV